jgi:hypothetical protein
MVIVAARSGRHFVADVPAGYRAFHVILSASEESSYVIIPVRTAPL